MLGVNKRHAKASPQIFSGKFPDGSKIVHLDDSAKGDLSFETLFKRLRRACDAFYYVLLSGYRTGLEAYWKSSVGKGKARCKALVYATQALEEAIFAWNLYIRLLGKKLRNF